MKIKRYEGPTEELEYELDDIIYELWRVHPLFQRLLGKGFVSWHEIDLEDEKNIPLMQQNPEAQLRERVRYNVNKEGTLTVSLDATWWASHDYENKLFLLSGVAIQLLNEHSSRTPTKKNDPRAALFEDASRYIVDEDLFHWFRFNRNDVEKYIPGKTYPDGMYGKVGEHQYRGRVQTEQFFSYLKEVIPVEEESDGHDGDAEGDGEGEGDGNGGMSSEGLAKLVDEVLNESPKDLQDYAEGDTGKESNPDKKDKDKGNKPGGKEAGNGDSTLMKAYGKLKVPKKKRWEEILFAWARKVIEQKQMMSWREDPKHLEPILTSLNARLPATIDDDTWTKKRERVIAFADTSGSCVEYFDRFAKAVMSLPDDKFDLSCFCFDTRIYPVDRNNMTLKGGGGTDLQPCVNEVNRITQNEHYYPTVFCITDGYFSIPHSILHPEKWFFFLTEGCTDSYLPKESKVFHLKDFA